LYTNPQDTEQEWLARIAAGDAKAFEALALRYAERVVLHALTFVKSYPQAEEMAQDIFLKIWTNREKLPEVKSFDNYLFILSRNHLISALRKKLLATEYELPDQLEELLYRPDQQYEHKELQQLVYKGIDQLPQQKREILQLIHYEGLSQEEAGKRLGIAPRTVRWRLVSALNFLRAYLSKHTDGGESYLLALSILYSSFFKNF
jgi:RNA polymerase sigma-70 factor (ECF subfamily)